jgi:branched-chain amino acid transport system substrate-binding protein
MAIAEELQEGPIPGLDTVFVPEGSNQATPAIEAARIFTARKGLVAVVGHSNSSASLAVAPIYNAREVLQIAPTASAVSYSDAGAFSFRLVPPDDRQGAFIAQAVRERLPSGGRLAVLYVNDDYGRGLRRAVLDRLDARYPVVVDLPHVETDVGEAEIAQARDAAVSRRPDILLWLGRGTILLRFVAPLRAALPELPILGGDAISGGGAEETDPGGWGTMEYVAYVDMNLPALRDFAQRYRERFGVPADGPHALTYDATRLILRGIREGARTGPDLRAYFQSLGRERPAYDGVTGPVVFDERGDVSRPYVLAVLRAMGAR